MNKFKKFCDDNNIKPSEKGSAENIAFLAAKAAWYHQQARIDEITNDVRIYVESLDRLREL